MLGAAFLFALMGVCVKLASARYGAGEIVMYRSLFGVSFVALWSRWRGGSLRTAVPGMHAWRATVGVISLALWFYAIGSGLPLATAMTLNYMSSVWMALFLIGGAVIVGGARIDGRLIATVLAGFAGVALVLRPTLDQAQLWHGVAGLASGMIAAMAYLQVTALGRAGEPDYRIVFYFSAGGVVVGAALAMLQGGFARHDLRGAALLTAIGLLATAAQLMMTRAYAIGSPLINASLHYSGIGFRLPVRCALVRRGRLGDGAVRHRADRRGWRVGDPAARAAGATAARRAARSALTMPAWTCTAP
jgi:drug/metabolite transporter (DMT)-like permease